MRNVLRIRGRFQRVLLTTALVMTCTAAPGVVQPAFATDEGFSCSECTHVTNKENWVKNVESYNFSGLGTCDYLWDHSSGKWVKIIDSCVSTTHGQLLCLAFELVSHGETTRTFNFLYNLYNRQDNYASCA